MAYQVADQTEMYREITKLQPGFVGQPGIYARCIARISKGLVEGDKVYIRNVCLTYRGDDVLVEQLGEDRKPNGKSEVKPADPPSCSII